MSNQLKLIKELRTDASNLRVIEKEYKKVTANPEVDKHLFYFGAPNRTLNAFSFQFALVSYTGRYGSSSVSNFRAARNQEAVRDAFYEWANKNRQLILEGIASELDRKAANLFEEAQSEINHMQSELDEVRNLLLGQTCQPEEGEAE
jgi:hypothetical protein